MREATPSQDADASAPALRASDAFVVAAWAALGFGLLEGLVLDVSRAYPVILAPYKTSAHVLWVAPLVDLALFVPAAAGVLVLLRLARPRLRGAELRAVYGLYAFLGIATVVSAPKLIHPLSVVVLAGGLALGGCRALRGAEPRLTALLRRRLVLIPLALVVIWLGVSGFERANELWRASQLGAPLAERQISQLEPGPVRLDGSGAGR